MKNVLAYMLGRCANGAERDKGTLVHYTDGWKSLCGREPGRRSAGWGPTLELPLPSWTKMCDRCQTKAEAAHD